MLVSFGKARARVLRDDISDILDGTRNALVFVVYKIGEDTSKAIIQVGKTITKPAELPYRFLLSLFIHVNYPVLTSTQDGITQMGYPDMRRMVAHASTPLVALVSIGSKETGKAV